jgi:hypothetical protein
MASSCAVTVVLGRSCTAHRRPETQVELPTQAMYGVVCDLLAGQPGHHVPICR